MHGFYRKKMGGDILTHPSVGTRLLKEDLIILRLSASMCKCAESLQYENMLPIFCFSFPFPLA